MSLGKASSPTIQMVDNIKRASRQSDPVTRETNLMEEAIRPPSPFLHILQPNNTTPTSHNVISPNLGEHIKETASKETVGSTSGIPMAENVSVPLTHGDNNDIKLNANESKRTKSILATRRLAGIQRGKGDSDSGRGELGKNESFSNPFVYRTDKGSISCKSLPPLLTPGVDLIPDLLKEVRAGWEIASGSLASDRGLHWLRNMAMKSEVVDQDDLSPLTTTVMAATRVYFSLSGNSIKESVAKIAANSGASFILTGEGKSKWLRIGPSEGIRLVLDVKRLTLKVWSRPNSVAPSGNAEGSTPSSKTNALQVSETLCLIPNCERGVSTSSSDHLNSGPGDGVHQTELIDSLGRVRTQEDLDEEISFTHCPVISQRIVPLTHAPRLFLDSPGIKDLTDRCRDWEGPIYPPPGANETFAGVICRLKVDQSAIAGRGTFLVSGELAKHELLGFYEGVLTLLRGPYVMNIFTGTSRSRNVDGCPVILGHESPFGMMNEDLYMGIPNVEVLPSGLFRAIRIIRAGEELVIRYASGYDWSSLKSQALAGLSQEIATCTPELWHWVPKTWENLKRPSNPLSRWIKKMIEGTIERDQPQLLHSSSNSDFISNSRERLARLLTSGVTARRYNFRVWNRENEKTWKSVRYVSDERQRERYTRTWNYHELMDVPFGTVYKDNENIKNFCQELYRMERPNIVPRLVACPPIAVRIGELKITLDLGKRKLLEHLGLINRCANHDQLVEFARKARIWKVSYRNNPLDDSYPGEGWCGYLAIDQIMRNADAPANIRDPNDQRLLSKSLGDIVKYGLGNFRANWRSLKPEVTKLDKEVVLSVIDTLMQASSFLPPPVLRIARWLPTRMLTGLFPKHNFSKWTLDPDDEDFNIRADGQLTGGTTTNVAEWRITSGGKLMTIRRGHYHVRSVDWLDDMEEGFSLAIRQLGILMGIPSGPPASVGNEGPILAPSPEDRANRSKRRARIQAEPVCSNPSLAKSLMEPPGNQAICEPVEGGPESTEVLSGGSGVVPNNTVTDAIRPQRTGSSRTAELKVIFWNANTWNAQNCEKLVETVSASEADVICILDARLDNFKTRYIGGYCNTLQKATGKTWRAKLEARPDRRLKCSIGGDILFYSEKCTKVVKSPVLPYGTLSSLTLIWEGINVRVVSVYRPYDNKECSEGSLRTAVLRALPDFERDFWEEITKPSDTLTIIGGDFNLGTMDLDNKLLGTSMKRIPLPEGATTYVSLSHPNGSVIDHVISNSLNASSRVSPDGSFIGDHFPLIGSAKVEILDVPAPSKRPAKFPPCLSSGDTGGLRRLNESLKKQYAGNMETHSVEDITEWTVREARKIAASRHNKHNPNGWSPLSRLLHLRLRALGALYKRHIDGASLDPCYRLYKDSRRDSARLVLSDDELDWLENNGIVRELPVWREWLSKMDPELLRSEIQHLKRLTTKERRDELRLLHGGRMRRIQDQADAGKIGAMLRGIMAKSSSFSLDVLYNDQGNIVDTDEISRIITDFFKEWFNASEDDDLRDEDVARLSGSQDEKGCRELAQRLNIPWEHAREVLSGMADKEASEEVKIEAAALNNYIPSYEEFENYIKTLNPRSAGGPSGLTYLLVQQWPSCVKIRVHAALSDAWSKREKVPGWGRRWLQPIPKVQDPGLADLRPLMLVEVTRKIWVGLIMGKIANFWKRSSLIDDAQHAYICGKGTHTAIPQLSNCLEAARDYKTDIFISSWDMKRAFDSLGKRFIIRSLTRLHIPLSLATFMTSLDEGGDVFVRSPKNIKIAERGLRALDEEGDKFQTRKGTGQGDIPSPLLWVAALDTLLTILRRHKSEFKTLDLKGDSHPVETIAFADDLLSIESTMEALQAKAHLISAWCILTGIEISYTKLRTFGIHWGPKKNNAPLIVHSKEWTPSKVPMLEDGTLKHLGLKSDMDANHSIQKADCIKNIKALGETIMGAISRSRDKCCAIGYCVRTNIGYRAQHCSWSQKDYSEVDGAFLSLVKKATHNMNSFPSRLLVSNRKHGGLGIISISDAAHERKRKMLLQLVNRPGAEGIAAQGLLVSALRSSGQGGAGLTGRHIWPSLEKGGIVDSLVTNLKGLGLRLRAGDCNTGFPVMASRQEEEVEERIELNARGIALEAELHEGETTILRIGQVWLIAGRIFEILAYSGDRIEFMEWEMINPKKLIGPGRVVIVSPRDDYQGYPTGMGGRNSISREEFVQKATHLVELSEDWLDKVDKVEALFSMIIRLRRISIGPPLPPPEDVDPDWAKWQGGDFLHVYTDGSHATDKTLTQFLMGKSETRVGGAVILSDGHSWVHRIFVEIDVEVNKAYDVELICILIANEMAVALGKRVIIHSDCQAAINVGNGSYSDGFINTISGWSKGPLVTIEKVRAHPENYKHHTAWDWNDKGIWTADRVAGKEMESEGRVKASTWLKRIGKRSLLVIEESDGTPFIGSIRDRASRLNMVEYWKVRDEWRVKDGLLPKWAGTNMAMAFSLLKRNGSLEDHATMSRLAAGKRWEFSRHNKIACKACLGEFRGLKHPLLKCNNLQMLKVRKIWMDNCKAYIDEVKPGHLKPRMLDILYEAVNSEGGEFACLGTFMPKWAARLEDGITRPQTELRAIKKFLRVVASGGRLVMREFARLKEVSEGEARELRQLSIAQFIDSRPPQPKTRKTASSKTDPTNAPKDSIWGATDRSSDCRLEWSGRIQCALIMDASLNPPTPYGASGHQMLIPGALAPEVATPLTRPRRSAAKGLPPFFPWTGLNWFNPVAARANRPSCTPVGRLVTPHPRESYSCSKLLIAPVLGGKPTAPPGAKRPIKRTMYRP